MAIIDLNNLTTRQAIRLNEISVEIKKDFNQLIQDLVESKERSLAWLLHPLVSRNNYESNFFIILCQLILIRRELSEDPSVSTIVVHSEVQKEILNRDTEVKTNVNIVVRKDTNAAAYKRRIGYHLLKMGYRAVKMMLSKSRKRARSIDKKSPVTLIDTFLTKRCVKSGKYIDRYYSGILEYISSDEARNLYWVPTILSRYKSKDLKTIHESSKEKLLFKQDFLTWKDYVGAFYNLVNLNKPDKQTVTFLGMNVTELVEQEFKSGKISSSAFDGLLNYRFVKRLKQANVQLRLVVDWNENQPIDKGFIKGVHDFYPSVKVKGYQGYIISTEYNFYISPTDFEIEEGIVPDQVCVVGNRFQDLVRQFSNQINVASAPAFRFDYLLKESIAKPRYGAKKNKSTVLILLPIGMEEINNILESIYDAFEEQTDEFEILVKPHPMVDQLRILDNEYWRKEYTMIGGSFGEALDKSDLIIGNSSSALVESVLNGVPVIVIGSRGGITQNPIPPSIDHHLWSVSYDSEAVKQSIPLLIQSAKRKNEVGDQELQVDKTEYLEEVNKETVRRFLDL